MDYMDPFMHSLFEGPGDLVSRFCMLQIDYLRYGLVNACLTYLTLSLQVLTVRIPYALAEATITTAMRPCSQILCELRTAEPQN